MWYALDVTLEAAAREAVEYALMEAGALGTETCDADSDGMMRVAAYFDAPPERESVRAALFDALKIYGLPSSSVREMSAREVAAHDWLAEWKRGWQPVEVGQRFIVAPPWSELDGTHDDHDDRIIIRIEPGMAFGTGTHETTRLCLAAIEKHFAGGSFLDAGTGTGILAIAAAKISADARIEACDTDPACITIAHQNARLNGVAERIDFRIGTVNETNTPAACVCANLTADVILPLLPSLLAATRKRLILSGILTTQTDAVLARLRELGIAEQETATDGEWTAIVVFKQ
ncbi:MAG TPA: 50S ribosomal protein L11 methyltransferase [Pyrinomonadaceae bacterium]